MDFTLVSPDILNGIGIAGFALYVTNYTMLSLRLISGDCLMYFCLNLTAATCVLIGLSVNFNLAAALVQGFFISMSLIAIGIRLTRSTRSDIPRPA